MDQLDKLINSLIGLFKNSPQEIELTGDYCINDECYIKVKIDRNNIIGLFIKFKNIVEK